MKLTIILLLSLAAHTCYSQTSDSAGKYNPSDTFFYAQKDCEIQVEYPGGKRTWQSFVDRNLRNRNETLEKVVVAVEFRVDKAGNVSNIQVLSGPSTGGYREEALRLIKKSGKWVPAVNSGHQANAMKNINIEFPVQPPL